MSLGRSSVNGDRKYSVKSLREQDGEAAHSGTGDVRGGGSGHKRGRWMQRAVPGWEWSRARMRLAV